MEFVEVLAVISTHRNPKLWKDKTGNQLLELIDLKTAVEPTLSLLTEISGGNMTISS